MNEFDLIKSQFSRLHNGDNRALNFNDDIAWLEDKNLIISTDTIVENVHFRTSDSKFSIGKKAMLVNISDIIAKGAKPVAAFINITWNKSWNINDLPLFVDGVCAAQSEFGAFPILGGDTTSASKISVFSVTIFGEPLGALPVLRSGAKFGDALYVTGFIGDALIGLESLQNGVNFNAHEFSINHYLMPNIPKLKAAKIISEFANASIDISDGLLGDAQKLCFTENFGLEINIENIPFSDSAKYWLENNNKLDDILRLLSFGDDYQSLFSVAQENEFALNNACSEYGIKITKIGNFNNLKGLKLKNCGVDISLPNQLSFKHEL